MEAVVTNPVHIGHVIRNAIVFNFSNSLGGAVTTDSLLQTVSSLFALLDERQIEYLLVGGIALLQYMEGRNTQIIDLIMAVSSLEKLPEIRINEQNVDFARGQFNELQIDLLLTRYDFNRTIACLVSFLHSRRPIRHYCQRGVRFRLHNHAQQKPLPVAVHGIIW